MIILGIETTCDETAASIVKEQDGAFFTLSNIVSSQIKLHSKWGGVVPNLAAREHLKNIVPVLKNCLQNSNIKPSQIDLISVANGPGLIPALLIGVNAAKTLSYIWKKPLIGVHHIEGHIYANLIDEVKSRKTEDERDKIKFPVLCLVVSGGHTQLILIKKHLSYRIIGETLDDAAGEAFDKVARILNLGYPGGPAIAVEAEKLKIERLGSKIKLPRPMINSGNFNFSFSGLKTAVLYETKKNPKLIKKNSYISALCHEFQQSVCDVLVSKTIKASQKYKPKTIMLAGGVSANQELRNRLSTAVKRESGKILFKAPKIKYCVDNAAMIAIAGFHRWKKYPKNKNGLTKNWKKLSADANLKLS